MPLIKFLFNYSHYILWGKTINYKNKLAKRHKTAFFKIVQQPKYLCDISIFNMVSPKLSSNVQRQRTTCFDMYKEMPKNVRPC